MTRQVGVGIIGCGARVTGLARALKSRFSEVEVVALSDSSAESIRGARERLNPDAVVFNDFRELCAADGVDWVMVGSWNAFHREHSVCALQAGRHVFCEKPLATTLDDCLAIRDAQVASNRIFSLGLTLRYAALYRRISELLKAGGIGELISFEFNENLGFNHGGYIHADWRRKTEYAGSHVLEKCCHDIDLANWFVGRRVKRVASFGGNDFFVPKNAHQVERIGKSPRGDAAFSSWRSREQQQALSPFNDDKDIVDNQVCILEYEGGVRATFHTNCCAGIVERRMLLLGGEGAIRADLIPGAVEHRRLGWDEPTTVYQDPGGGHGDGDTLLIETLGASMLRGAPPEASVEQGLNSALVCFGIDQALETGEVVDLGPLWKRAR